TEEEADTFAETRGWRMKKDADRGWRRVVPSPTPLRAVVGPTIRKLVEDNVIVVAGGGGGIPVYVDGSGYLEGIDAVIDKDLGSAVLADEIGASILCILTTVDRVALNFGTPDQQYLETVTLSEMKKHLADGHFPEGSMGPKIRAAIRFLEQGGEMVAIASLENARKAVLGEAGTRIVPD
ncbi:MAG: carbamate kinase, partial [candidate division Zixibacteria bacterium]|nr:carbamate kinase [candidate division Zixibacteria bacterium]